MKKKGFTLIELLAVIVILAIIALIATPMIMNVIEKARRGAAIESVNGIVDAAEKYQLLEMMDNNETEKTFDLTEDKLQYKGGKPESGTLQINDQGKIYVIAKYGNYCIEKGYNDERPQIIESETCEMTVEEKDIVVSVKYQHAMKIDEEGNLWGWGYNEDGQLGDGTTEDKTEPVQIKSGTKFQSVSVGYKHTIAIDEEGNLWGWGYNEDGQLGDGTTESKPEPIQVMAGTKFASASSGDYHTMAIDTEGNLWGWGDNLSGQLGDGTTENKTEPVQIKSGMKFKSVSSGGRHTMAIDVNGNLWGWGENGDGQLGVETPTDEYGSILPSLNPIQIKTGTKFKVVSAGRNHTMAIDEEGNLWGWGWNAYGQLGDGTTEDKEEPIQIKEEKKFKSVSGGEAYTIVVDSENNIYTWGTIESTEV